MSHRVLLRVLVAACTTACVLLAAGPALAGDANAGDVWVDNVGQPAGPGHEMDPHLACADINLWGAGLADTSGSYTIDGWPPSGSQEQDYASGWSYSASGTQVVDVISVKTLVENAVSNGDTPQSNQGFHFKLEFSQDPQKHKTFWVDCATPTIATTASSGTVGQPIQDVATISGSNAATGTISWSVYAASDATCSRPLNSGALTDAVNGDGTYTSPAFTPSAPGTYQWVATYEGDAQNLSVSGRCGDPAERSTVAKAAPSMSTTATSSVSGEPVYDVATLTGGDAPTGTITWNVYPAGGGCTTSLDTVTDTVNGDGVYLSPGFTPAATGSYEWVASYSGDPNNTPAGSSCSDPKELSTVQMTPAPAIALVKFESLGPSGPLTHGPLGVQPAETIDYRMTVVNTGNTPLVIAFSDPHCDPGSLSEPAVLQGTFDAATSALSSGGAVVYTCSHVLLATDGPQFTNTASVTGQPPSGPPVSASDSVEAVVSGAAMTVVKLQRDGSSGSFTTGEIAANAGDTMEYEIRVTDTGSTSLALMMSDPRCDAGTIRGPIALSGGLSGNVLSPGGVAEYTCSHVLSATDPSPFTNTATVTGQPPMGPPLTASSSVSVTKLSLQGASAVRCGRGKTRATKRVHGRSVVVCVEKKKTKKTRRRQHHHDATVGISRRADPEFTG